MATIRKGEKKWERRARRRKDGFLCDLRRGSWYRFGLGRGDDYSGVSLLRCETKREILEQPGSLAGSTGHEEGGGTTGTMLGALPRLFLLACAQLLAEATEELLRGPVQGMYTENVSTRFSL